MFHGVCDEYSTLFVSFARALNLPSRQIALGDISLSLHREGHSAVEIWDGNIWIHIELTGVVVYNSPLPQFYFVYFATIDTALVLIRATDYNHDGLLLVIPNLQNNEGTVFYANYTGPNQYTF